MTSERMVYFLADVLKHKEGYMVVMDNATTHGTQEVRRIIQETSYNIAYLILLSSIL